MQKELGCCVYLVGYGGGRKGERRERGRSCFFRRRADREEREKETGEVGRERRRKGGREGLKRRQEICLLH